MKLKSVVVWSGKVTLTVEGGEYLKRKYDYPQSHQ